MTPYHFTCFSFFPLMTCHIPTHPLGPNFRETYPGHFFCFKLYTPSQEEPRVNYTILLPFWFYVIICIAFVIFCFHSRYTEMVMGLWNEIDLHSNFSSANHVIMKWDVEWGVPKASTAVGWNMGTGDNTAVKILFITMPSWWLANSCATTTGQKSCKWLAECMVTCDIAKGLYSTCTRGREAAPPATLSHTCPD